MGSSQIFQLRDTRINLNICEMVSRVGKTGKTGIWCERKNEIPGECFREWNPNTSGDFS